MKPPPKLSIKNAPRESEVLFDMRENTAAELSWACAVYAMIPYLGIVFTPFSVIFGSVGLYKGFYETNRSGCRRSLLSIILSVILFFIHIFLWWLLYAVPKLGRTI
jgi:hypothetical protein